MIRRLFADEADRVHEWFWRDSGKRGDFAEFFSSPINVFLSSGDGGAMFVWRGPGIYEVHLMLEQRGKEAMQTVREMLSILRSEHGAKLFWAAIPTEARNVIMFTRLMGWKSQGHADLPHVGRCELYTGE